MTKPFLFVTGNSGGHVYPALALAECLNTESCTFVINQNKTSSFLLKNYPYSKLEINEEGLLSIIKIFFIAYGFFKRHSPHILIATGARTTIPFVIAAYFNKCPIFLLEQNVIPGRSNRLLQFFAQKIFLSFKESASYFFQSKKLFISGNPIREKQPKGSENFLKNIDFKYSQTLLVIGGSQGSFFLNNFFLQNQANFSNKNLNLIVCCGENFSKKMWPQKKIYTCYNQHKVTAIFLPYVHDIQSLYRLADLIVCRAGATTISELIYYQKKAILIPYPYAKDNHQLYNAKAISDKQHFNYIQERDLSLTSFMEVLSKTTHNTEKRNINPNQTIIEEIKKLS